MFTDTEDEKTLRSIKSQVRTRSVALYNMWWIILSISFTNFYVLGYSIRQFVVTDDFCNIEGQSDRAADWSNIMERSINYVWWMVPVLYVFWPADHKISDKIFPCCCKRASSHHDDDSTNSSE